MRLDLFHLKTFKYRYHFHLETVTGEILNQKERNTLEKKTKYLTVLSETNKKNQLFMNLEREGRWDEDFSRIVFCILYIVYF